MTIDELSSITPLVMFLNKNGTIIEMSSQLRTHLSENYVGHNILEIFDFTRPSKEYIEKNTLQNLTTQLFLFIDKRTNFAMRGQLSKAKKNDGFWFVISPWLTYIEINSPDLIVTLPDFMRIDSQLELKVLLQTQNMMMSDMASLTKDLEKSLAIEQRFIDNMSHELRSPLHTIIASAELISYRKTSEDAEIAQYIDTILDSTNILLATINQVLDYSRSVNADIDVITTPINLIDLSNKVFSIFQIRSNITKIKIKTEYDLPENLPTLSGDLTKITNSLINLLTNAFRYSENGEVIFRIYATAYGDDSFNVRFEIQDEGPGIPVNQLPNLFKPFSKIESHNNKSKNYSHSTGLGLSITKNYIDSMNGEIGYKAPQKKKGSIFWFSLTLPIDSSNKEINQSEYQQDLINNFPKKILIVDDVQLNTKLTVFQFDKMGINAVGCDSGAQALDLLKENDFDMILLDIQMPDMDGFETISKIRALPNSSKVPIFAWTATVSEDLKSKIFSSGFSGYLSKPTTSKMILDLIKNQHSVK